MQISRHGLTATALAVSAFIIAGQASAQTAARAAAPTAKAPAAAKTQNWSAWGGSVAMRWNRDLAGDVGMRLNPAVGRYAQLTFNEGEQFDLVQTGSLDFSVRNGNLSAFAGGSLQARGGWVIETRAGRIDMTDFRIVPRAGSELILDIVSKDGKAWFYVDRLMYQMTVDRSKLAVRTADVMISPELARHIGHPEVANWAIADLELSTEVVRQGSGDEPARASLKWHGNPVPGVPGATYQADLFMQTFNTQYMRCDNCATPTPPGLDPRVVFAPNSTLRNNVNNGPGTIGPTVAGDPLGTSSAQYTADIPWYAKFQGIFAPYQNDQHPYLIWNLYRYNPDGSIDQIGRSGVKHAFLTLNTSCIENPNNGNILGRGCSDLYSTGNNDASNSLGPRSEIIPSTNQWGRCGSVYDLNCDGVQNSSGYGSFDQRLVVRQSQILPSALPAGTTFRFESWYLARQDINILNSMASTNATFVRNSTTFSVTNQNGYRLGPAIDRWVDPAAPGPNERNVYIQTPEGSIKVAMKAIPLGGGTWRYHYAVMNLDFARPVTQGAEPNLRVISANGFDFVRIPAGTATITDVQFSDGDVDASNDWVPQRRDEWQFFFSASRTGVLNWGTMFRFSFTANQPPGPAALGLHIASDNSRDELAVPGLLGPVEPVAAKR